MSFLLQSEGELQMVRRSVRSNLSSESQMVKLVSRPMALPYWRRNRAHNA